MNQEDKEQLIKVFEQAVKSDRFIISINYVKHEQEIDGQTEIEVEHSQFISEFPTKHLGDCIQKMGDLVKMQ